MVYLLHFDRPINSSHTAQHYLGSSLWIESRLNQHRSGKGARLCKVARERGIGFTLARTWQGGRKLERKLKQQKNGKKLCPICAALAKLNAELDTITLDSVEPLEF